MRFFKPVNVYSHVKDNKIHLGIRPEEVYEIFNGNACGIKKSIGEGNIEGITSIDQSTLQYYLIPGYGRILGMHCDSEFVHCDSEFTVNVTVNFHCGSELAVHLTVNFHCGSA